MARTTLLILPASALVGDEDALIVAGDLPATFRRFQGRPVLRFDDTDEMCALTPEMSMPSQFGGGALHAVAYFFTASANSGGVRLDVSVEAKTANTDTLDLESASSFDSVNSATHTLGGTAGDPRDEDLTLSNADSVAASDLVRFAIRRDTDHTGDTAAGDVYLAAIEIYEDVT